MQGHKITNQHGLYFLPFTVVGWIDVFARQSYREVIIESLKFCQREKGVQINAYVIMSNHMHLITNSAQNKLSHEYSGLNNPKWINQKIKYIHLNPVGSGLAEYFIYSSASKYLGENGILDVEIIDVANDAN